MTTLSTDPALYIFTSLTAGSSHIVTATSRLETILRANRVPFKALDIATDDKARMLWRRRAGKDASGRPRKFPALVQEGLVLGDIVEIEEWNEYGELRQHVKIYYDEHTIPDIHHKHPPPKMKRPNMMQKASSVAGSMVGKKMAPKADSTPPSSNLGTPAPENPPPAPDLTKAGALDLNKSATAPAAPDKGKEQEAKEKKKEEKKEALPMRSVADEAAQKAKELRLKSLREKVHGKGAGDKKSEEKKEAKESEEKKETEKSENKVAAIATPKKEAGGSSTPGLQSPTSGKWKSDSGVPAAGDVQSPRSSTWKAAEVEVPKAAVKKPEEKAGTKEQPKKADDSDSDDDSEEDDEEESDEEEEDDDEEEESEEESEDEDDEDDSDEDSDEDDKKPAAKPDAATAGAATPATTEKK